MQYDKNDTVYFKLKHKIYSIETDTWSYADPDTGFPKITIIDPEATKKIDTASMEKKAVGKYEYLYQISLTAKSGWWTGYIDVTNNGYPNRETFGFEVKE